MFDFFPVSFEIESWTVARRMASQTLSLRYLSKRDDARIPSMFTTSSVTRFTAYLSQVLSLFIDEPFLRIESDYVATNAIWIGLVPFLHQAVVSVSMSSLRKLLIKLSVAVTANSGSRKVVVYVLDR